MAILNIAPVTRAGIRLLISLYGLSETGKTLSALRLAAGIEPDPSKRMLLDTEGGQRGRAYVDHIDGGYLYAWLTRPFTPERYAEAIAEIEARGVSTLVIDSISHAWFGEGGILEIVEVANEKNDMAKWAKPKRRLAKMTGRMLASDMHIILCSRGKQPLIEEYVDGRKKLTPGPVVPIQEKSLRFDMTIMAQMLGDGQFTIGKPAGKCPGMLRDIFAAGQIMDEAMGRKLGEWAGAEGGKSPAQRRLESDAVDAAEAGTDRLMAFWNALSREQKLALKPGADNLKSIAAAADKEAAENGPVDAGEGQTATGPALIDDGALPPKATAAANTPDLVVALKTLRSGATDWKQFQDDVTALLAARPDLAVDIQAANQAALDDLAKEDAIRRATLTQRFMDAAGAAEAA